MVQVGTKTRSKRYRKTEDAILEVLMKSNDLPSAEMLVRKAHISRSTLYRHHKTVPGIIPDYEKDVLKKYSNLTRRLFRHNNTQIKSICLRTLIFILAERRSFMILLKYSGSTVIEKMVLQLKNKLKKTCCLPMNPDRMLRVYAKEIAGVIEEWGNSGFPENDINDVLGKILYLTNTMKQRLEPVNH